MGKIRFSADDLRKICIKNYWFTDGSNESYKKLFERCKEGADFDELALLIWFCTPDSNCKEIYYQLLIEKANMRLKEFEAVIDAFHYNDHLCPEELDLLIATKKALEGIVDA